MIILDTCTLIFDALTPDKLSQTAKKAITNGEKSNQLFCCDISLWEIAMLIQKKRLEPGVDTQSFLQLMLEARQIQVLPITIEIASLTTEHFISNHFDLADRLIVATTIFHQAKLVTCDKLLRELPELSIVW
jgi:PIN domain nuclease of toxin-antitoxin system